MKKYFGLVFGVVLFLCGVNLAKAAVVYDNTWNPNQDPKFCNPWDYNSNNPCDWIHLNAPEPQAVASGTELQSVALYLQLEDLTLYKTGNCWWGDYGHCDEGYAMPFRLKISRDDNYLDDCISDNYPTTADVTPGSWQKFAFKFSNCPIDFANGGQVLSILRYPSLPYSWAFGVDQAGTEVYFEINSNGESAKTPVLVVPGIMGTNIEQGSETLWANLGKMLKTPGDDFMSPLSYTPEGFPTDDALSLGTVIDRVGTLHYTDQLISDFENQGYSTTTNLYLFPYDWRRDIGDVAGKDDPALKNLSLKQRIDQVLASSNASKLDIIAHSQGGLVVKSLLEQDPAYAHKINKLIFVGTPNLGAPMAAKVLLYGDSMGVEFMGLGLNSDETKKITQNMPAVYQLLPSQEYYKDAGGYISRVSVSDSDGQWHTNKLNFADANSYLVGEQLNSNLLTAADNFHTKDYADFDKFDFTGRGMKVYNLVGCQAGTPDNFTLNPDGSYQIFYGPGDGTVPIISANNLFGVNTLYALESSHASMLSQDGIRQEIVDLIDPAANLSPNGKITPIAGECHFNGKAVAVHSPVQMDVYDSAGNHLGPTPDGGFDDQIPNANYSTIGHEKFAYLPDGGNYIVKFTATGNGDFSFDSSIIQEGQIVGRSNYNHIPVALGDTAQIELTADNNAKINFTSNSGSFGPSSTLTDPAKLQDDSPPIATSTIVAQSGQSGFYRGPVTVTLSATDNDSGVAQIFYRVDSTTSPYSIYSSPIQLSAEGGHSITFFAVDNAGNGEPVLETDLVIDNTAPEITMQFSPEIGDLVFTASDDQGPVTATSSKINLRPLKPKPAAKILDNGDIITATDAAGNVTKLTLKDKDRRHALKADIKSLSYNGVAADLSKVVLHFDWLMDKNNQVKVLTQQVKSKGDFNVLAIYGLGKTLITGKDQSGKINLSFNSLILLKATTKSGDFIWGF